MDIQIKWQTVIIARINRNVPELRKLYKNRHLDTVVIVKIFTHDSPVTLEAAFSFLLVTKLCVFKYHEFVMSYFILFMDPSVTHVGYVFSDSRADTNLESGPTLSLGLWIPFLLL